MPLCLAATMTEEPLAGGNASAQVVRVGDTVRKPWFEGASGVLEYMRIVRERGVDLPEPVGRDAQGRLVTEFVDGALAMDSAPLSHDDLRRVGAMVRNIHDASQGLNAAELGLAPPLIPAANPDLVCHGDLTPWNLVVGSRWVFIDWDGAAVSSRIWDLAYSAQAFTLNDVSVDPPAAAQSLCAFLDGYGADAALRRALVPVLPQRTRAMYDMLRAAHSRGAEPWASMFVAGHGEHWRQVASYVDRGRQTWAEAIGIEPRHC